MVQHISIEQFFDSPAMVARTGYLADVFKNEVNARFFTAVEPLEALRERVGGIIGFCAKYGEQHTFLELMNRSYQNFTDAALLGKSWDQAEEAGWAPQDLYEAFVQTFSYQNDRIRDLIPYDAFANQLREHTKGESKKGFFAAIQQIVKEPLFRPQCEEPGVAGQPPRPTEESVIHYAGNRDVDGSNRRQDGSPGSYLAYIWSIGDRNIFFRSVDPSVSQRQAPFRDELIECINASEQLVKLNLAVPRGSTGSKTLGGDVLNNLCALLCLLDDGGALEMGHVRDHLFTRDSAQILYLAHKYQRHVLNLEAGSGHAASDRGIHEHTARITPECWFTLKGLLLGPGGVLHEKQQGMIIPPSRSREVTPEAQMFDGMSNAENPSTTLDSQATMTSNVPARGKGPPVLEPGTPAASRVPDRKEAILVPERLSLAGSGARPADLTAPTRGETVAVESKVTLNPVVVVGVIAVGLLLFFNRP